MACCRQGFLLRLSALRYVLVCLSMRAFILWTITVLAIAANGAERRFDFSEVKENELPPGFRSALTGGGAPGVWKVVLDDVPPRDAAAHTPSQIGYKTTCFGASLSRPHR